MSNLLRRVYRAALRHYALVCLSLGLLLFLPSLRVGFYADDLWQQALLDYHARGSDRRSTFELCRDLWSWDAGVQDPEAPPYLRAGSPYALTWFADPELRVRFFRPLSAWTLLLNHRLGGADPLGYHVFNLALWLLLAAAVLTLHRTLLPDTPEHRPVLLLAGLFFVLDEAHVVNVSWLSARHGLLSVLLSVTSLVFYIRYRQRGGTGRLLLAAACLALALFAGETAVMTIFWLAACEIFLARDPVRKRLAHLAPLATLILAFAVSFAAAGYGTEFSGWYLNPLDRPLGFLATALADRLPAYVMGALTPIPPEISHMVPGLLPIAGKLFALALVLALVPHVRSRPVLRCTAAAVLASLLFLCIVLPFNYKMLFPSVGVALLLGSFTVETGRRLRAERPDRLRAAGLWAAVALVVLIHGIAAPLGSAYSGQEFQQTALTETREQWRRAIDWPEGREEADVYLLSSPGAWSSTFLPYRDFQIERRLVREYLPVGFQAMDYELTRLAPATLRLRSEQGLFSSYFAHAMASLVRPHPVFRQGERFEKRGLTVWVDEVRNGNPVEITVRFPRDLDDEQVWLLSYDGVRIRRLRAPGIGRMVSVPLRRNPPGG